MPKLGPLFVISVVLFFSITSAARTGPMASNESSSKAQHAGHETESFEMEESCGGVGEEECLMRRTLAAHLDYIYTNRKQP
ncbi:hypothetical protein Syun_004535 [Stephania yunnanensis]|uniref:Phytosulfokine n=1 Tax=Stephania yunnanensis TaxID=152371 RepID=A0AAP0L398_9MAGN